MGTKVQNFSQNLKKEKNIKKKNNWGTFRQKRRKKQVPIVRSKSIQPPHNLTPDNQMTKVQNFSQNLKKEKNMKKRIIGGHSDKKGGKKQAPIVRSKSILPPYNLTPDNQMT